VCDATDGHCRCIKGFHVDKRIYRCVRDGQVAISERDTDGVSMSETPYEQITRVRPIGSPIRMAEMLKVAQLTNCCDLGKGETKCTQESLPSLKLPPWRTYSAFVTTFVDMNATSTKLKWDVPKVAPAGPRVPTCDSRRESGDTERDPAYADVLLRIPPVHMLQVEVDAPPVPSMRTMVRQALNAYTGHEGDAKDERAITGDVIAKMLRAQPSPLVANVASAWWLWVGQPHEAEMCALHALRLANSPTSNATAQDKTSSYLLLFSMAFQREWVPQAIMWAEAAHLSTPRDRNTLFANALAMGSTDLNELAVLYAGHAGNDSHTVAGQLAKDVGCFQAVNLVERALDLTVLEHQDSLAIANAAKLSQEIILLRDLAALVGARSNKSATTTDVLEAEEMFVVAFRRVFVLSRS
jgi:hypothetical protein